MTEPTIEVRRFERVTIMVPDEQRPGRRVARTAWQRCYDTQLAHAGETYRPNALGWFEVPVSVAHQLLASPFWWDRARAATVPDVIVDDTVDDAPRPRRRRAAADEVSDEA